MVYGLLLQLQRDKILFISGNYSRILNRLTRNFTELEVRRAFTVFQLMNILAEVFHARTSEVEEMIQSRLEERSRPEEEEIWQEESEEKQWPATFCVGE